MSIIAEKYAELPKPLRRPLWQWWHKRLIKYDGENIANFMNYGYESLNGDPRLKLVNGDESDRFCIQLYDHVVNREQLKGKKVLEVGSGRGGGASYITRYYQPERYIGLDISDTSIEFCNNHYKVDGLSFTKGFAEKLPFKDKSFDYVVNVESARGYKDMQAFFNEVYRVLKDDGKLLIADIMYPNNLAEFKTRMERSNFKKLHETDITKNVAKALEKDSSRREQLIDTKVPGFLKKAARTFAATEGSPMYRKIANGTFQYWSFVMAK